MSRADLRRQRSAGGASAGGGVSKEDIEKRLGELNRMLEGTHAPSAKLEFNEILTSDEDIQQSFRLFDTDNSNEISREELEFGLKSLGLDLGKKDVDQFMQEVDKDRDGLIQFSEFETMIRENEMKVGTLEDIQDVFRKIADSKYATQIDKDDLRRATKKIYGAPADDKLIDDVLKWTVYAYDYDKNGTNVFADAYDFKPDRMNLDQFVHAVQKYDVKCIQARSEEMLTLRAKYKELLAAEEEDKAKVTRTRSGSASGRKSPSSQPLGGSGSRRTPPRSRSPPGSGSGRDRAVPLGPRDSDKPSGSSQRLGSSTRSASGGGPRSASNSGGSGAKRTVPATRTSGSSGKRDAPRHGSRGSSGSRGSGGGALTAER